MVSPAIKFTLPSILAAGIFAQAALAQVPYATPALAAHSLETQLWPLVLRAHPVVQGVMAILAFGAFVVLVVLIQKLIETTWAAHRLRQLQRAIPPQARLSDIPPNFARSYCAQMLTLARGEIDNGAVPFDPSRLNLLLQDVQAQAAHRWRRGMGMLAQIAATGPFVGLFGTVFGIMNAFLAMAESKTTNLAVVAPGIAEALLATAIGLAAAIPAVLVNNIIQRRIAANRLALSSLAVQIEAACSRIKAGSGGHP